MRIISYLDFLNEGRRSDIKNLINNKEECTRIINEIEREMMQVFNNINLVNKYIYNVAKYVYVEHNDIHDVIKNIKRLVDWEPRMKSQQSTLNIDQLDKMTYVDFKQFLDNYYNSQPYDKWKLKGRKQINVTNQGTYEIVHIPNWQTAKRYIGDKLSWCIAESEDAMVRYTSEGQMFVFAFKGGYASLGNDEIDRKRLNATNDKFDTYATSALAIKISKYGTITVTNRYNNGENIYGDETEEVLDNFGILNTVKNIYYTLNDTNEDINGILKKLRDIALNYGIINKLKDKGYLDAFYTGEFLCNKSRNYTYTAILCNNNVLDLNAVAEYIITGCMEDVKLMKLIGEDVESFVHKYKEKIIDAYDSDFIKILENVATSVDLGEIISTLLDRKNKNDKNKILSVLKLYPRYVDKQKLNDYILCVPDSAFLGTCEGLLDWDYVSSVLFTPEHYETGSMILNDAHLKSKLNIETLIDNIYDIEIGELPINDVIALFDLIIENDEDIMYDYINEVLDQLQFNDIIIDRYINYIDWEYVTYTLIKNNNNISDNGTVSNIIRKYHKLLNWDMYIQKCIETRNVKTCVDVLSKFSKYINWNNIKTYGNSEISALKNSNG